jgi:hypothetical protein
MNQRRYSVPSDVMAIAAMPVVIGATRWLRRQPRVPSWSAWPAVDSG